MVTLWLRSHKLHGNTTLCHIYVKTSLCFMKQSPGLTVGASGVSSVRSVRPDSSSSNPVEMSRVCRISPCRARSSCDMSSLWGSWRSIARFIARPSSLLRSEPMLRSDSNAWGGGGGRLVSTEWYYITTGFLIHSPHPLLPKCPVYPLLR